MTDRFAEWIRALESRHLADLTFAEVARSLRALSSTYVERRGRIREGAALSGNGKRAAFALFYGPLHYILIRHVVTSLSGRAPSPITVVDLGCGTGVAGAAWAGTNEEPGTIIGIDRHSWALDEASRTFRELGLRGRTRLADVASVQLPKERCAFVAAFSLNELGADARDLIIQKLLQRADRGDPVLIVEPLAGFVAPWWKPWAQRFESAGGRADEWRVRAELPEIVSKLDHAAGLHHDELTGRTISANLVVG